MPVSGRELATLDFSNLIGGPLNAIVEAQAKSAITTANFIREVGFDKDKKVINVDFVYNKKNDNGEDEEFSLTLPFITMLPIPYVSISYAEIEFNAKITSTTESKTEQNFDQVVQASAGASWWFASARVTSKTAYQKKSASSDREERTFDMHVRVEARNVDMPAGTERILTLLENTIQEKSTSHSLPGAFLVTDHSSSTGAFTITVTGADLSTIKPGWSFAHNNQTYAIKSLKNGTLTLYKDPSQTIKGTKIKISQTYYIENPPSGNDITLTCTEGLKQNDSLTNGSVTHIVSSISTTSPKVTLDDANGFAVGNILTKA